VLYTASGRVTSAGLLDIVDQRARELGVQGARPEQPCPVVTAPDADGIVTLLASWRADVVPAPLNAGLTGPERDAAMEGLAWAPPGTQAILWTSGTSGRPRGVALGREGLEAHVRAVSARLALDGSEVWLASLSPAHVGGLALIARALLTGATLVAPGVLDTRALVRLLRHPETPDRPAVTHLSLVPTQLDRLLHAWGGNPAPEAVRCVLVGGARAPADLVQAAVELGWPVALTYGMTEMWSQVATAPPEQVRRQPGAVGRPLPGVEVRFGEDGALWVRGPSQALGYVTSEGLSPIADEEGWYWTGDLGAQDSEGVLTITGRGSDRIVSGGVNVDPLEVEEVIRAHPAVRDAAVVGLPSEEWGERVAALVVPVWDSFDLAEVERWIRARLSGPKRPKLWKVERELPRNANGKVDRASVRARLSSR
jgi:O-succinylbenzoic acid--CoA ligase